MTNEQLHTMRLRLQWQDDKADKQTDLMFHEYEKVARLRPVYAERYQSVEGFKDSDGNEATMYVTPEGYLTDSPRTMAQLLSDPISNAVGKLFAVTALMCIIAFFLGVATGVAK